MTKLIIIEELKNTRTTTWLITMYSKKHWWSTKKPTAQWTTHSKKTIMKKATDLLEHFHKLEMEIK